jgi:hypothetical protein
VTWQAVVLTGFVATVALTLGAACYLATLFEDEVVGWFHRRADRRFADLDGLGRHDDDEAEVGS